MVYPTPVNETYVSSVSQVARSLAFMNAFSHSRTSVFVIDTHRVIRRDGVQLRKEGFVSLASSSSSSSSSSSLSFSRARFVSFRFVARTSPQDARPNSSTSNGSVVVDADPPIDARIASNISFFREHTGSSQSASAVGVLPGIVSSVSEAHFSCCFQL